ncbi:hypothetical protein EVAR_61843_1 [Eumeta japonica]|uniref:Uncharacterized protein n=1 Tax=Eumeta variegata TaxID=151549 RepID=A0A4C1YTF0_EUMVA|nr:hypothetical protein EVAR_61843_1 [Eumeta japonica]
MSPEGEGFSSSMTCPGQKDRLRQRVDRRPRRAGARALAAHSLLIYRAIPPKPRAIGASLNRRSCKHAPRSGWGREHVYSKNTHECLRSYLTGRRRPAAGGGRCFHKCPPAPPPPSAVTRPWLFILPPH